MSATDDNLKRLEDEGIIHYLYSTRPDKTRYYVFLVKNEHGATVERKVPQMKIGEVLSEVESAGRLHGHRFEREQDARNDQRALAKRPRHRP